MTVTTNSISVNEVQTTIQKSFEAAGVPWDVDFRAGVAAAWLEQCGFEGVRAAARALDANMPVHAASFVPVPGDGKISERIDAQGRSGLIAAGYFLDYAAAMRVDAGVAPFVLEVVEIRDAFAAGGWLAKGQFDGVIELCAFGREQTVHVRREHDGALHVRRAASVNAAERLVISCAGEAGTVLDLALSDNPSAQVLSNTDLIDMQRQAVVTGLTPPADAWRVLKQAARGILVPSTDLSRAVGAGGGDANQ